MRRNRFESIKTLDDLEKYSRPIRRSFSKIQNSIKEQMKEYEEQPEILEFLELQLDVLWIYYIAVEEDYRLRFDILSDCGEK